MSGHDETYYLVRADCLPEALKKTAEVKQQLLTDETLSVQEAVNKAGMSRSSFYKYRDAIFPFNAMMKEKILTLSLRLEHRSGLLSQVLASIAQVGANVLTIHQTIPLQGMASIVLSMDTSSLHKETMEFLHMLQQIDGVVRVELLGRSDR
ncbi:ACT domain-containing protein [Mechercharimyces sp. CAU 1602]|uniref:ACT domain-containing protein n=1 Tax=Mechercharimyces sp. CAU 1602 TaxID=2973933 RepID=UPI002162313F|nr:ACT domain-containing protein [Mechercharimyces sp. CAU 1602]MCS1351425.1 ACT domain-containing protein [Mechercharimyces sp. CAU 1602]